MKRILYLLAWFACLTVARALPSYDPFTNAVSSAGTSYTNGATLYFQTNAFGEGWADWNEGATPTAVWVTNVTLGYGGFPPNFPTPPAASVFVPQANANIGGQGACLVFNRTITADPNNLVTNSLYASFLLSIPSVSGMGSGVYWAGFIPAAQAANLSITSGQGTPGVTGSINPCKFFIESKSPGFDLGPADAGGGSDAAYSGAGQLASAVLFVVFNYQFGPGTGDYVSLWVNPSPGSFGSSQPPAATASHGVLSADQMGNAAGFYILDRGAGTMPTNGLFLSDLRVGTTWSFVTGGPEFTSQPTNESALIGQNAVLSGAALAGGSTVSYQWLQGGINLTSGGNISGATTASLTLTSLVASNAGSYTLIVTNAIGAITSSIAVLTLSSVDPYISVSPQSMTNNYGSTASFRATEGGTAPFTNAWFFNGARLTNGILPDGAIISGATTTNLVITNVTYLEAGSYLLAITNVHGNAVSGIAQLTVNDPYIVTQPSSLTNTNGTTAIFTAAAAGTAPLNYEWVQNDADVLSDGGAISGSSTASLTIANINSANAGTYNLVVVGGSSNYAISSSATLTVTYPFGFSSLPQSRVERVGDNLAFSAVPNQAASLQWKFDGANISGATGNSLALTNIQATNAGSYTVVATSGTNVASATATLSVSTGFLPLSPTNLVLSRVGDGAQNLNDTSGNTLYLDQFTPGGGYVSTIMIPNSGPSALVVEGGNPDGLYESLLTSSQSSNFLNFAGYNISLPNGGVNFTGSSAVRGIGAVNGLGYYTLCLTNSGLYSAGSQVRNAISTDGLTSFWTTGNGGGGVKYLTPSQGPSGIPQLVANLDPRALAIFNGNLYLTSGSASGGAAGLSVFIGLPFSSTTTTPVLSANAASSNPDDMAFGPDGNTIYLADDSSIGAGGGIQRWDNDGTQWNLTYILGTGVGSTVGARGLVVDFSNFSGGGASGLGAVIYATTAETGGNRLISMVDNATPSAATVLATAGTNQFFRGVRFGPVAEEVSIVSPPENQTNQAASTAVFSVSAAGSLPIFYQWQFNGTNISGATASSLSVPEVQLTNDGTYAVVVFNGISTNGASALLFVDIDTNAPVITGAKSAGLNQVEVMFSVPLTAASATSLGNYSITGTNGSLTILSASQDASQENVFLNVNTMPNGAIYTVTVNHLTNEYALGSVIAANSQTNFIALTVSNSEPPVIASAVTTNLSYGSMWQIAITNLESLAGWSDSNNQAFGLSSVGPTSAKGVNVSTDGTTIYYNGELTSDDSFTYTVTNVWMSAVGTVYLNEFGLDTIIPSDANDSVSLNGMWHFYFERTNYNLGAPPNVSIPADPQPFQQLNFVEGAGWTNLAVPGNWEMFGFSPCTYFSPDDTCGLYRDWIQVPQSWAGRRVYLNFDGVLDGAQIWLNGQPVPVSEPSWNITNYHESAWTGFQVDLTSQVQFGTTNLLAVRVIKSTPSDDLDTGDYFVMGGIHRSVTMFSVPQTNFTDLKIETHLLAGASAQVDVTANVVGGNAATPVAMFLNGVETDSTVTNGQAVFTQVINNANLWSSEFPNLYPLTLQLKDTGGNVIETITNRVGIREITITNGVLYLNRAPIKFAGVCDHDSSVTAGSAVDKDFWRKEIMLMKAANVTAIRTTHYPFDSAFYDVCDELGMFVSDELPYCWCDNETPEASMQPAFEQRARETIRRDRNHPCVVIWAIGNENSAGQNLQVVADLVKSLDSTRPRLVSTFNATAYNTELSDAHYPSISGMASDAANGQSSGHPFIFLENPNTWDERLGADPGMWEDWGLCMQRAWSVCLQYPTLPGTFPFEWSDRSVQDPNSNASYTQYKGTGVQLLYYFPATGVHLLKLKGMVDGFRNERPNVYEMQMIYSPIQISNALSVANGQVSFTLHNFYAFTDLSYLTTAWQLQQNGIAIASGTVNPSMPPLTGRTVQISVPNSALTNADTLRLDFIHPNGNDVFAYQFALTNLAPAAQLSTNLPDALPIPSFNLITYSNYSNPNYWTECERFPEILTNIVLTPANATTLAQLQAMSATVSSTNGRTLGTLTAGFTNNVFSYTLKWTSTTTNVQELGWIFQMPSNYDHFSWKRSGRWTVYPSTDICRAIGTAIPNSTNSDVSDMSLVNAFDFNSTKYSCTSAALTTVAGDGLRLQFSSPLYHCKGGASGGSYTLYANQQVSPANDINANDVPDLFMTLNNGSTVSGSFTVGSNSNLVSTTAGSLASPVNLSFPIGGVFNGNQVELNFNGNIDANYSVWVSTNLLNWDLDGTATEISPGQYQFTDPSTAINFPARYFRISSP